jgi:octaprenyl-diphosphate synthase
MLDKIQQPVSHHMQAFEGKFREAFQSKVALLDIIMRYIVKRKGKQMRPLFVFLTAEMCGGVSESTYRAATLIELSHTATLIHDDVVDDSYERRGFFSLNALWKNKISVLVGDYLLAKGLLLAIDNEEYELLKIVSTATRHMSEGELLQIEKARFLDIKEEVYFDIIRKKTASLIASCTAIGAQSAGVQKDMVEKMHAFGEAAGIAFQIRDDLFDYGDGDTIGKPRGIDIKEKKMTLPLIYLLQHSDFLEKRKIIRIVKSNNQNPEKVNQVITLANQSGGIQYAREKMLEYRNKAISILHEFPENPSRIALEQLVIYTTERNK